MKQAPNQNQRRSRGRGNNPNNNNNSGGRRTSRNQTYESNGPEIKVRGSAQQVLDKYLQLARDCQSGGDRVKAEAYLQFAEHYYRIVNVDQDGNQAKPDRQQSSDRQQPQDRQQSQDRQPSSDAQPQSDQKPVEAEAREERSATPENQPEPASEQRAKERTPRGRGRGRPQNVNGGGGAIAADAAGVHTAPSTKNEATLAAEAAAANEAALKATQVKKPARKPAKKTIDANAPVVAETEGVELDADGKEKAVTL